MNPEQVQRDFFRRLGDFRPLAQLFDLLPDVAFYVKDRDCRAVMNNRRAVECWGAASEAETIGQLGYEYFTDDRMALYLEQDRQVMETGVPILNAICPAPEKGNSALIMFSKVPLRDRRGRVIGLAGIHREIHDVRSPATHHGRIARVIKILHERYEEPLTIRELAAAAGVSRSQLDRQFRQLFGITPREYLVRVRVHAACRLLVETNDRATEIAMKTGFYDHSHFGRTFRRIMGACPRVFRQRHASDRLLKTRTRHES